MVRWCSCGSDGREYGFTECPDRDLISIGTVSEAVSYDAVLIGADPSPGVARAGTKRASRMPSS
jgi:hypothetical protein